MKGQKEHVMRERVGTGVPIANPLFTWHGQSLFFFVTVNTFIILKQKNIIF